MSENDPLVPSPVVNEKDDLPPFPNPDLSLPKANASLNSLKKQSEEAAQLQRRIRLSGKKLQTGALFLSKFELFQDKWLSLLQRISFLSGKRDYRTAIDELMAFQAPSISEGSPLSYECEKEASLIRPWLLCRLTSLCQKQLLEKGSSLSKDEAEKHYQRCLNLPEGLESGERKQALIDEARGFLYDICKAKSDERVLEIGPFLSLLPFWRMGLSLGEKESSAVLAKKASFCESLSEYYNQMGVASFKKSGNLNEALTLFNLRDLFPKDQITFVPFRYAYDEKELKLYYYESEALESNPEQFRGAIFKFVSETQSPDDFYFLVLAHLLALPGLGKERFETIIEEMKLMKFEMKIELLAASMGLGMPPARVRDMLKDLERTHPKKGNLEAMAKSLLFIKKHLNEALLLRFDPMLENLLRSPHAHKVAVKSADPSLRALFGETAQGIRLPLGAKMKNTSVSSWGKTRWLCYLIFGVSLPVVLCLFSGVFIYLYSGFDANQASFWLLLPFSGLLIFYFSTVSAWMGRDERGGTLSRSILLGDSLWKSALASLYFILPSYFGALDRVRYALVIGALGEALLSFFYFKHSKKSALLDYILFGLSFCLLILATVFMVLDMMRGIV